MKFLRSQTIAAIIIVMAAYHTQAQKNNFISVKGKNLIGANGKPFLLRGTNLGNWLVPEGYMFKFKNISSPRLINTAFSELMGPEAAKAFWTKFLDVYIARADIHYLKSTGMNSIRIPFNYRLFTNEEYLGKSDSNHGFLLLDKVLRWCKEEGLYVILDMHCAPGGQTGDNIDDGYGYPFLFDDATSQQLTIDIWRKIASHYKNETIVIGYDLLNEPIAHYFDSAHFNPKLEPLYKRITQAIRTVDKNHILFLGGAQWDSNFKPFGKPFDSKLVYTFHKYWTEPTQAVVQDYIDFSNKYDVPIYVGETGENKDEWVKNFRIMLEKNSIGWHYWPYKKMDNNAGIMSFKQPDNYKDVIDYTEKQRSSFEDMRKASPTERAKLIKAIEDILINSKFENCTPNTGYIEALGLNAKKQ
jgi:endoglucanase